VQCSLVKAILESDPACSTQRWIVIGGLITIMLMTVCCAAASFWLLYRRLVRVATAESQAAFHNKTAKAAMHDLEESSREDSFQLRAPTWGSGLAPEEEWDPEPPNEADAVPVLLYVSSPQNQTSCSGEYELVPGERPNGQPLWAKKGSGRWIYSGTDGRWYIGGLRSKDRNFACASGFIYCNQPHRSMSPDELTLTAGWEWGQGVGWNKDPSITVTAMEWPVPTKVTKEAALKLDAIVFGKEAAMPPAVLKDTVGLWPRPLKDSFQEDGPGPGAYVITHDHTAVTSGVLLSEPVDFLSAGTLVSVVEVTRCEDENRIRGRIEKPEGWISLENTQDGYRWARRQGVSETSTEATTSDPSLHWSNSDVSTDPGSFTISDRKAPSVASAPFATPGQSPGLRGRAIDTPDIRLLPPKEPPRGLSVCSPNGQLTCVGVYELVPKELPNGNALWKKQDSNHWLYCGKNGRWCIAGIDVKKENFARSAGFISQTEVHRELLPDECTSPWQRWDGTAFQTDPDIRVTIVDVGASGPSQLSCSTSSAGSSSSAWSRGPKVQQLSAPKAPMRVEASSCTPAASSCSTSSAIEVMIECVQAEGVNVAGISRWQRCISRVVAEGRPWRIGPRLQPQLFSGVMVKAWPQDCLFELSWRSPCLCLTRPAPGALLLLDGAPARQPQSPVPHGTEIGLCETQSIMPLLTLRVTYVSDASQAWPPTLRVTSPHKQAACVGDYVLVAGEQPNGFPLWEKVDGNRWIYSGTDGRWYVGGPASRTRHFQCSTGYLYNDRAHGGLLPHQLPSAWAWGDSGLWHEDALIGISAVSGVGAAAAGPSPLPEAAKPCIMDLRGCGLSAEGKSVVQASRCETLRVIV